MMIGRKNDVTKWNYIDLNIIIFYIYIRCNLCLGVCLSDHNAETPGPIFPKFEWGPRETHGNVFSLVLRFEFEWVDFYSEKFVSR